MLSIPKVFCLNRAPASGDESDGFGRTHATDTALCHEARATYPKFTNGGDDGSVGVESYKSDV